MDSPRYLSFCRALDKENIIECVNKGLDKSLGNPQTRDLVLKTLKVVHKLDEKDIPSSLDTFESSMTKTFGE